MKRKRIETKTDDLETHVLKIPRFNRQTDFSRQWFEQFRYLYQDHFVLLKSQLFLRNLLHNAMKRATKRQRVDQKYHHQHKSRGDCSLQFHDVQQLWFEQRGYCAISGLPLLLQGGQYQSASLERINNNKGYTKENCQLICYVFNTSKQMTRDKLYYILFHQETHIDFSVYQPKDWQHLHHVMNRFRAGNKAQHHKDAFKSRHALSHQYLLDLFQSQHGCCAYSGLRLRTLSNSPHFFISLERLNRQLGYIPGNVAFIIQELNIGGQLPNLSSIFLKEHVAESYLWKVYQPNIQTLAEQFQNDQLQHQQQLRECQDFLVCEGCHQTKPIRQFMNHGYARKKCIKCRRYDHKQSSFLL